MMPIQTIAFDDDWNLEDPNKKICITPEDIESMERELRWAKVIAFDFETSGTAWWAHAEPCGVGLGCLTETGQTRAWYIPYRHQTGEAQWRYEVVKPLLQRILEGTPQAIKLAHNIKFDEHMARREGVQVLGPRYDTMIAARLYDENRSATLKERASTDLQLPWARTWEDKLDDYIRGLAKKSGLGITAYKFQKGYAEAPIKLLGFYCCHDIEFTLGLYKFYEDWGVSRNFARVCATEMALTRILCDMEETGMHIDVEYLKMLQLTVGGQRAALEEDIQRLAGKSIHVGSDVKLREYLLGDLGLPLHKKTKSGALAVDAEVLAEFSGIPVVATIMKWREAEKIASTYTESLLTRVDKQNILHGSFNQMGTDTGRLSCAEPNLQNLYADDDDRAKTYSGKALEEGGTDPWSIRRAFLVRGKNWVRAFFDYSQIELRVLAYFSQDPVMLEAYITGQDIHERTSLEVFGSKEKVWRRKAKIINFGLCIAEGQRVLTQQDGLVPIEQVQKEQKVWDGVEWVEHDGVVCNGEQDVVSYDGITATPEHEVFTDDGERIALMHLLYETMWSGGFVRHIGQGAAGITPLNFDRNIRSSEYGRNLALIRYNHFKHKRKAMVYDLLNAGPRHRFTVEGKIVSNSYCMGPGGLARQTKMSIDEASKYLGIFFQKYAGVAKFREWFWAKCRAEGGQFSNLFGRCRRIPELMATDEYTRTSAERRAIGSLIQGTAAELTKESLVRVDQFIRESGIPAKIVTTIHDEIQIDVPIEHMAQLVAGVKERMERYLEFHPVPILTAEDYTVTNWAEKHKIKH